METEPIRPQYLCPGKARLTSTYRFRGQVGHLVDDPGQVYGRTIERVLEWLSKKEPQLLPVPDWHMPSFRKEEQGQVLECVSLPHRHVWAIRLTHPDVGLGEQYKPVAGRSWTTDVSVVSVDGQVHFGIEVFASTLNPEAPQPAFIRPGAIKSLCESVGLAQVRPLDGKPWTIESTGELDDLEILLGDKGRNLAVLVATQPDPRYWTGPGKAPETLVDCEWLARKTVGYAHVVKMPFSRTFEWTERVGKAWSVFDGAVRTYMPGLDFGRDSLSAHPIAFKDRILAFGRGTGEAGAGAFEEFLLGKLRVTMPRVPFPWQPLVFVPDARVIEAEERSRETLGGEACRDCQEQYDKQAEALKEKIRAAEEEAEKWLQAADEYQKELDYQKHQASVLQCAVDSLRAQLEEKSGKPLDDEIPIPDTYEGMPDWVDRHLAGRLVFLPRAARAVKDAVYQDVPLVYKGLLLLANEYRNMRLGFEGEKERFEARCGELALRFGRSMTEVAAGQYESEYYVDYPVGSGLRQMLDFHLRKGSTKDDRLCLGIYFFWDEQARLVVVGSLPAHLKTSAT